MDLAVWERESDWVLDFMNKKRNGRPKNGDSLKEKICSLWKEIVFLERETKRVLENMIKWERDKVNAVFGRANNCLWFLVFGFVFGLWWWQHLSLFFFFIKKREKESWKLFRVLKWVSTEWRYKWKEKEDINVKDDLSKSFCYYLCNQWIRWIIGHVILNCIYYYCHAKIYKFLLCTINLSNFNHFFYYFY